MDKDLSKSGESFVQGKQKRVGSHATRIVLDSLLPFGKVWFFYF